MTKNKIEQVTGAGLETGSTGLEVCCTDHSAMLSPAFGWWSTSKKYDENLVWSKRLHLDFMLKYIM